MKRLFAGIFVLAGCQGDLEAVVSFQANQIPGLFLSRDSLNGKEYETSLTRARLNFGTIDILTDGEPIQIVAGSPTQEFFIVDLVEELDNNSALQRQIADEGGSPTGTLEFALANETKGDFSGSALNFEGQVQLTDGSQKNFQVQLIAPAESFLIEIACEEKRLSNQIICPAGISFEELFKNIDFDTLAAETAGDITINALIDSANVSEAILTIEENLNTAIQQEVVEF